MLPEVIMSLNMIFVCLQFHSYQREFGQGNFEQSLFHLGCPWYIGEIRMRGNNPVSYYNVGINTYIQINTYSLPQTPNSPYNLCHGYISRWARISWLNSWFVPSPFSYHRQFIKSMIFKLKVSSWLNESISKTLSQNTPYVIDLGQQTTAKKFLNVPPRLKGLSLSRCGNDLFRNC
jgi:hypothetical protein